jgi:hypothetical protein
VLTAIMMAAAVQAVATDEFPKQAYVMVQCVAGPNETVSDCRVLEVSHPGQGLEDAAIAMVRRGRIGQSNGVAVGQTFRIRIAFRLADEDDETPPPKSIGGEATPSSN